VKLTLRRRLLFAALTVPLALLVLEAGARATVVVGVHQALPPEVAEWVETNRVVYDPELGWRPASRSSALEGGHFIGSEMDREGRAREPGRLYGFAFGDSQTHGAGLAESNAWPSVAERLLRGEGHPVTLINMASSGYRSAQVLRLIETYVLPRGADFLIVDCMLDDGPPLPPRPSRVASAVSAVLFESRLYRVLWLGVAGARGQNLGPSASTRIEQPVGEGLIGVGNHAAIAALAREEGLPLVFVDYPFWGEPAKSLAPGARLPAGVAVAPATAALVATGRPASALFLENNHLTVEGSEIVGRSVADTLSAVLYPAAEVGN
jgi:hypothetical protein